MARNVRHLSSEANIVVLNNCDIDVQQLSNVGENKHLHLCTWINSVLGLVLRVPLQGAFNKEKVLVGSENC